MDTDGHGFGRRGKIADCKMLGGRGAKRIGRSAKGPRDDGRRTVMVDDFGTVWANKFQVPGSKFQVAKMAARTESRALPEGKVARS